MKHKLNLMPDLFTYNAVLDVLAKRGLAAEAWAVIDDMKGVGIDPDIQSYNTLLQVRFIVLTCMPYKLTSAPGIAPRGHRFAKGNYETDAAV